MVGNYYLGVDPVFIGVFLVDKLIPYCHLLLDSIVAQMRLHVTVYLLFALQAGTYILKIKFDEIK